MKEKETQIIEFKAGWRDEYLKWICGFANAQGGKLYVGVSDDGEVCGVQDVKKLMRPRRGGVASNVSLQRARKRVSPSLSLIMTVEGCGLHSILRK